MHRFMGKQRDPELNANVCQEYFSDDVTMKKNIFESRFLGAVEFLNGGKV